jgi:peroxiredoxin
VPAGRLPATSGGSVDLHDSSRDRRLVVFAYPRTGRPGGEPPTDWDTIPGARGCTPEACSFRDLSKQFVALHTDVYGLSTEETAYQHEARHQAAPPVPTASDADLRLTTALQLPTFTVDGITLLRRLTMIIAGRRVQHVPLPGVPTGPSSCRASDFVAGRLSQS